MPCQGSVPSWEWDSGACLKILMLYSENISLKGDLTNNAN